MKKLFILSALFLVTLSRVVTAQTTSDYAFKVLQSQYQALVNPTVISDSAWDDNSYLTPIGFNFTFLGKSYTQLYVDTYGMLDFGGDNINTPPEANYIGLFADYFDKAYDHIDTVLSPISYELKGTVGNRILKNTV